MATSPQILQSNPTKPIVPKPASQPVQNMGMIAKAPFAAATSAKAPAQTTVPPANQPAPVAPATAAKAVATPWNASPDQTTAGQLEAIIDKDSPLMQQAKTKAAQQANARGLMNSSMAVGAAQNAVIEAAAPIANADAALAANRAQFNAQNQTQISGLNATEQNKFLMQGLDNNNKIQLMDLEAKYKNQLQSSQSSQTLYQQVTKNMTDILMSDTMDENSKRTAIENQIALLNDGMRRLSVTSGLDLGGILDFGKIPGGSKAPAKPPESPFKPNYGDRDG